VEASDDDHRHCKVCGKVVGLDIEVCSKVCKRRREEGVRARKNLTYLIYGGIAFLILLTVLTYVR
jgi:predicted nucleic acid-binding Zn ribbon protein